MVMGLTSVQNPRVKQWSQLLTRKGRDIQGSFIVEGFHLLEEAIKANAGLETVLYAMERKLPDGWESQLPASVEVIGVSEAVLAKCSDTPTPQGVVGIVRKKPPLAQGALMHGENTLVVVLDGIQDPGNLGTIIRSADAVGASGVLLGEGTADLYNPKTVRSTMGSIFHLPIVEGSLGEWLPLAAQIGCRVIGGALDDAEPLYSSNLTGPVWLVIGSEGSGISPAVTAMLTNRVKIPMRGQAESLNAAMAATVLLYEALRQREETTQ